MRWRWLFALCAAARGHGVHGARSAVAARRADGIPELRTTYAVVTCVPQRAVRVPDDRGFMPSGWFRGFGRVRQMFAASRGRETHDCITGRFE